MTISVSADDLSTRTDKSLPKSVGRTVAGRSGWVLAGKLVSSGAVFFANVALARSLSPSGFGFYCLAWTIVLFAGTAGQLGLNLAIVRLIAASIASGELGNARRLFARSLLIACCGCTVVALLVFVSLPLLCSQVFHSSALANCGTAIFVWIIGTGLSQFLTDSARGLGEMRIVSGFGGPFYNTSVLACLLTLRCSGGLGLPSALLVAAFCSLGNTVCLGFLIWRAAGPWNGESNRCEMGRDNYSSNACSTAFPLLITSLLSQVTGQLDVWVVAATCTKTALGLYGAAARWTVVLGLPMFTVNAVLPPLIAARYAVKDTRGLELLCRLATTAVTIPSVLLLIATLCVSRSLMCRIFGPSYSLASPILIWLCSSQVISVSVGPAIETLTMTAHQRCAMVINLCSLAYMATACIIGSKYYGAIGVAAGAASTQAFREVITLVVVRQQLGIWCGAFMRPKQYASLIFSYAGRRKKPCRFGEDSERGVARSVSDHDLVI